MDIVVAYDVNTESPAGRKRLRRVAKTCEGFGQRVQLSVFECSLTRTDFERLRSRLRDIVSVELDSLRIYHLSGRRDRIVEVLGRDQWIDMSGPMVM